MGIRLIISAILFFSFSSRSFSKIGYLSNYWFTESFEKNIQEDNLQSIDPFLSSYASSYKDIGINQQKSLKDGSWYLSGFQTSLALGLKGKIGIHSWGGTKTIEIDWKRRAPKKTVSKERASLKNNKNLTGNKNTLFFNDKTTDEVINSKINFIITKARNSGRVRNLTKLEGELKRIITSFQLMGESLTSHSFKSWSPVKLRLDLGIKGNGKVVFGPLIKMGGDLRLRLEWKKGKPINKNIVGSFNKSASSFFKKLEILLNSSLPLAKKKSLYPIDHIEIGLGIGIHGDIGIGKIGGYGIPSIFFKKTSHGKGPYLNGLLERSIPVMIENNRNGEKNSMGSIIFLNLDEKRIKKGMRKALKFSNKFMSKLNKKIERNSKWEIKKIKTQFKFSSDGSLGPVKISGIPHIAFYLRNNNK